MILDRGSGSIDGDQGKQAYAEAALGLIELQGYRIPLPIQVAYLRQARDFCKKIDNANLVARINLIYARVFSRIGKRDRQVNDLIEESSQLARQTGDANVSRKTEIAKCVQLHWEGQIFETVDRWDKAVGNLEELSFEEKMIFGIMRRWDGDTASAVKLPGVSVYARLFLKRHQ